MLGNFGSILADCSSELSKERAFLNRVCGSQEFSDCRDIDELIDQLCQGHHIDTFNIHMLKSLLDIFESKKGALTKIIDEYEVKKEMFFESTTISQFMRAVVEKVEPMLQMGEVFVTIKLSRETYSLRTLKNIENLARYGFGESQKYMVHMRAMPGSIIISWVIHEAHLCDLEKIVKENDTVFRDAEVKEVTIGGRVVFPCTLEEVRTKKLIKTVHSWIYAI